MAKKDVVVVCLSCGTEQTKKYVSSSAFGGRYGPPCKWCGGKTAFTTRRDKDDELDWLGKGRHSD